MKKTIVILTTFLALSGTALASPLSSTIALKGGQAKFDRDVTIKLDKLLDAVKYDVSCDITSNHLDKKQNSDFIQVWSTGNVSMIINDQWLPSGGQTTINSKNVNHLIAINVYNYDGDIAIRNLDDTDTITVANCYANPTIN